MCTTTKLSTTTSNKLINLLQPLEATIWTTNKVLAERRSEILIKEQMAVMNPVIYEKNFNFRRWGRDFSLQEDVAQDNIQICSLE